MRAVLAGNIILAFASTLCFGFEYFLCYGTGVARHAMVDANGLIGVLLAAPAAFVFSLIGILVARKERQKGQRKMHNIFIAINGLTMGAAILVALSALGASQ